MGLVVNGSKKKQPVKFNNKIYFKEKYLIRMNYQVENLGQFCRAPRSTLVFKAKAFI